MKRTIQILSAIFLVQLILMFIVSATNKHDMGAFASNEKLLGLDLAAVDQITIEQREKPALHLKKKDGLWMLGDKADFPIAKSKLENSINKLLSVNKSWPVATTESATQHFRVADDTFERKLTFSNADKVVKTLLLGTSPGFKKIHARVAGANEIYQITYGVFEANVDPDTWADMDYLKLSDNSVVSVNLPDSLILQKNGEQMVVAGLTDTEETNPNAVKKLMQSLTKLRFTSVLGTENKAEYHQDKPVFQYALALKNGDSVTYTFSKLGESEDLVLKTSSHPYFFKVLPAAISNIQEVKRSTLVTNKEVSAVESPKENNDQSTVDIIPDTSIATK